MNETTMTSRPSEERPTYHESMGEKAEEFEKVFGPYGHAELLKAFEKVTNPDDWRDKIDTWIPLKDWDITSAAIAYFTSTEAKEEEARTDHKGIEKDVEVRITSCGYRMGPAGP